MPNLITADCIVDGYEFQLLSTVAFGAGGTAQYSTVAAAATIVTTGGVPRTGAACLQCAATGAAAAQVQRTIPAGHRTIVASFYAKILTSLPTGTLQLFALTGPTNPMRVVYDSTAGRFRVGYGTVANVGSSGSSFGPTPAADTWYLFDLSVDTSGTTYSTSVRVDGAAGTEAIATLASQTAADMTVSITGTQVATGPAATMLFDDLVMGFTLAEYPYGAHVVRLLKPTGDGTHVPGTNVIESTGGTDITVGTTTAFSLIDEVPPENTDYIQQAGAGTGNYAEVTFDNPTDTTIWGVSAWAAIEGAAANASDMTLRVVDSGGTTLVDQGGVGAVSGTTRRYSAKIVPAPAAAASWAAEPSGPLSGLKGRIGFASDVTPVPRALTFVLQYAAAVTTAAPDMGDPMGMMGFFGA